MEYTLNEILNVGINKILLEERKGFLETIINSVIQLLEDGYSIEDIKSRLENLKNG